MAGFGFSLPDFSAGLSSLNDIGERFAKIREDIESTLDATLRGDSPTHASAGAGKDSARVLRRALPCVIEIATQLTDLACLDRMHPKW